MPIVESRFGHDILTVFHTIIMVNEKGGTDAEVLHKMLLKLTRLIYPDCQDIKGKRVIYKIDGGPGRLNTNMLAVLRLMGVYLFPGVQNTTHVSQETDRNYGLFKSLIRAIIRMLLTENISKHRLLQEENNSNKTGSVMCLNRSDLPVIINGRAHNEDNNLPEIKSPFAAAFSKPQNLSAWLKCWAFPLTRSVLSDLQVRTELPIIHQSSVLIYNKDDQYDVSKMDLPSLQTFNDQACDELMRIGLDGEVLKIKIRKKSNSLITRMDKTTSSAEDRIKSLARNGLNLSSMFYTIGPSSVSTDLMFQTVEYKELLKIYAADLKVWENLQLKLELEKQAIKIHELMLAKVKYPNMKDFKIVLMWKMGVNNYKQAIESKGNARKTTFEKLWKEWKDKPFPDLLTDSSKPNEPGVPATNETSLTRTANTKFREVLAMGENLTDVMLDEMHDKIILERTKRADSSL